MRPAREVDAHGQPVSPGNQIEGGAASCDDLLAVPARDLAARPPHLRSPSIPCGGEREHDPEAALWVRDAPSHVAANVLYADAAVPPDLPMMLEACAEKEPR